MGGERVLGRWVLGRVQGPCACLPEEQLGALAGQQQGYFSAFLLQVNRSGASPGLQDVPTEAPFPFCRAGPAVLPCEMQLSSSHWLCRVSPEKAKELKFLLETISLLEWGTNTAFRLMGQRSSGNKDKIQDRKPSWSVYGLLEPREQGAELGQARASSSLPSLSQQ